MIFSGDFGAKRGRSFQHSPSTSSFACGWLIGKRLPITTSGWRVLVVFVKAQGTARRTDFGATNRRLCTGQLAEASQRELQLQGQMDAAQDKVVSHPQDVPDVGHMLVLEVEWFVSF